MLKHIKAMHQDNDAVPYDDDMTDIYECGKEQFWDNLQQKKALPQTAKSAFTSPEFKVRLTHVMVSKINIHNNG
jgi:hypothetical protein